VNCACSPSSGSRAGAIGGGLAGRLAEADSRAAIAGESGAVRSTSSSAEAVPSLLLAASSVAASVRAAVCGVTGLTSSAGIGHNKLVAKLVASLHKPDAQTAIVPDQVLDFLAPLSLRALPGIGFKSACALSNLGVETVADARAALGLARNFEHGPCVDVEEGAADELTGGTASMSAGGSTAGARAMGLSSTVGRLASRATLTRALGAAGVARLEAQCYGRCNDGVEQQKPPQSLTVEDSFKGCTDHHALAMVLQVLAPDMQSRLDAELLARRRKATKLTVRWRHFGTRTANNPQGRHDAALAPKGPLVASRTTVMPDGGADAIARVAAAVLRTQLRPPFRLTLVALTATKFVTAQGPSRPSVACSTSAVDGGRADTTAAEAARHCAFRADYQWAGVATAAAEGDPGRQPPRLMSKRQERALREAGKFETPRSPEDCEWARPAPPGHNEREVSGNGQGRANLLEWCRSPARRLEEAGGCGATGAAVLHATTSEPSDDSVAPPESPSATHLGDVEVEAFARTEAQGAWPTYEDDGEGLAAEDLAAYLNTASSKEQAWTGGRPPQSAPCDNDPSQSCARISMEGSARPFGRSPPCEASHGKSPPRARERMPPSHAHRARFVGSEEAEPCATSSAASGQPCPKHPRSTSTSVDDPLRMPWPCRACTFVNAAGVQACEMCNTPIARKSSVGRDGDAARRWTDGAGGRPSFSHASAAGRVLQTGALKRPFVSGASSHVSTKRNGRRGANSPSSRMGAQQQTLQRFLLGGGSGTTPKRSCGR